jgi:hypothetical protein
MGLIAPNILDVGDVGQLSALIAPRPLVVASGIEPDGEAATAPRIKSAFAFTSAVYQLMQASDRLKLAQPADLATLLSGS